MWEDEKVVASEDRQAISMSRPLTTGHGRLYTFRFIPAKMDRHGREGIHADT